MHRVTNKMDCRVATWSLWYQKPLRQSCRLDCHYGDATTRQFVDGPTDVQGQQIITEEILDTGAVRFVEGTDIRFGMQPRSGFSIWYVVGVGHMAMAQISHDEQKHRQQMTNSKVETRLVKTWLIITQHCTHHANCIILKDAVDHTLH